MSNNVVNLEEVSSGGRPFLKSGSYSIRCIGVEKSTSRKGNSMLVFKWEIVAPDNVMDQNGKTVKITGLQLTDWVVLTDMGFPKLKGLHKAAQLPMSVDLASPNLRQYVGKAVKVLLSTEAAVMKDDNTGEPMLDEQQQPITVNNYRIGRFNSPDLDHTLPPDSVAF